MPEYMKETFPGTAVDKNQFGLMWQFLQFGAVEPDVENLKELCESLRHMMMQKSHTDCVTWGLRYKGESQMAFALRDLIIAFTFIIICWCYIEFTVCAAMGSRERYFWLILMVLLGAGLIYTVMV